MKKVSTLFMYVAQNNGREDVVCLLTPDGKNYPLIATDKASAERMRPQAVEFCKQKNRPLMLIQLSGRRVLHTVKPEDVEA